MRKEMKRLDEKPKCGLIRAIRNRNETLERDDSIMYQHILTGAVLLICTVTDLKNRKIYKTAVVGYFVLALLGHAAEHTAGIMPLVSGLLPGAFCFLVSWISRQGLGYGDSALVVGCGLSLGLQPCMTILFVAFFLSGLCAAGLLVTRRAGRKKEIPFVPFLLLGVVIYWCMAAGAQL